VNNASYEKWVDAYQAAYVSPAGAAGIACPNCGALELQLVFNSLEHRDRGIARMWCANCLHRIFMAPCLISDYVEAIGEGQVIFPDFTLVRRGTMAENKELRDGSWSLMEGKYGEADESSQGSGYSHPGIAGRPAGRLFRCGHRY
jgi:hypothetical protein